MPLEERRLTLKRFEAGELDVLCNCMVLTEGFDSPRAEVCIIATAGAFAWTPEGGWKTVALAEIG